MELWSVGARILGNRSVIGHFGGYSSSVQDQLREVRPFFVGDNRSAQDQLDP